MAYHEKWKWNGKLQSSGSNVRTHLTLCMYLYTLASYDQVDLTNLAGAELIARQLQLIEQKMSDRFESQGGSAEVRSHLFMGSTSAR
eukprot:1252960-Karenia_brevis.AAC.1